MPSREDRPLNRWLNTLAVAAAVCLAVAQPTAPAASAQEKPGRNSHAGRGRAVSGRAGGGPGAAARPLRHTYACPPCGCEAHREGEKEHTQRGACPYCHMPLSRKLGSARKSTDAEMVAELKRFLEGLAADDEFSGAVLVARGGRVLFTGAYGEANKSFGVPNRVDTKFNLGSMNKMFTAVAIAQLAEAGKLSFDDPLARFRTLDDWMARLKDETPAFEPGTAERYSNSGYLLLGKIIEKVTGESYFDYVRKHIYEPAGMRDTGEYEVDKVVPNLALGYTKVETTAGAVWQSNLFEHVVKGGPAGGGYSTVGDLLRFAAAIQSGKLVGRPYVELLTSPKPEFNSTAYGYGFELAGRVVGHGGAAPGISANLLIYLDEGYVVAVLSNYDFGYTPVVQAVKDMMPLGPGGGPSSARR
jgi:CubicO group peptidase (beta-lactamase class C family)